MLNGTLQLHDIRDVEAFCADLIPNEWRQRLTTHENEDLLAYLVATCWELSQHTERWHTSFSGWVTPLIRSRRIDWLRHKNGRTIWRFSTHTYERPRPTIISLDTELEHPQRHQHLDDPAPGDTDLERVLRTRTGTPPPPARPLGHRAPRRAA